MFFTTFADANTLTLTLMNRIIIATAIAAATFCLQAQAQHGKRPRVDFDTDTPMVHDPVVALEDGVYHAFSTGRGLQHMTSADLKTWTVHTLPAITNIPGWTFDSVPGFKGHVWAPDIIRYRNKWWMAYSCSTFGKNTSAIGLMSAERLTADGSYPDSSNTAGKTAWKDEGCIVSSKGGRNNWNAIDPNFAIDYNGNPWMVWGSFWDGIQIARLDSTMHLANPQAIKTIARRYPGKRENPIEAPFIFKHGGYYYLFVSWDYCCKGMQSTYRVAVGRSRNIEGPYTDHNGTDMANGGGRLVIEGDKKEFEAVGHNSVYSFNGKDYFFCHGYSIALGGASVLVKKEITWTANGWPELK